MNRLTYRGANGKGYVSCGYHGSDSTESKRAIVAERLAAYEDTGLEPEQISVPAAGYYYCPNCGCEVTPTFHEYCSTCGTATVVVDECYTQIQANHAFELLKAEEAGLLVRQPCKVGDMVYHKSHFSSVIVSSEVNEVLITKWGYQLRAIDNAGGTRRFDSCDLNRKWFLAREAAEAALKGRAE